VEGSGVSDWDEWLEAEQEVIDLLAEELYELDRKLKKEISVLDHHRRHIGARFEEVTAEINRIPKLTASKLRKRAEEVKRASSASRDVTKLFDRYADELEREAERLLRIRKLHE